MTNTNNENDTQIDNDTQYADENDVESINESRGSHILSVLGLFIKGTSRDIVNSTDKRIESMKNLMIVTLVAPIVCLIIGYAIAANADHVWSLNLGKGFITWAGFLASILCAILLVRARIYAMVIIGASKAARAALNIVPNFETEKVREYVSYFFGIMAWVCGVCLYAQIIPIWRSLSMTLMASTAMLCLAAMMAARWFAGKKAQYTLLAITLLTFGLSSLRLASPRFVHGMDAVADYVLGNDGRTDAEKDLLRKYNARLEVIRANAADKCDGKYCSANDANEVEDLKNKISLLETGRYWDNAAAPARPPVTTVAAPAKTEAKPAKDSSKATPTAPKADQKTETRPASKVAEKAEDSDPFAALDQFPDVKPVE